MTEERVTGFAAVNLYERGQLAMVELNSTARRNALGGPIIEGFRQAAAVLAARRGTPEAARCIILTGAGNTFCSGGDIAAGADLMQAKARGEESGVNSLSMDGVHDAFYALRELDCPLVAAVNGAAIGMGLGVALAADLIVAARSAVFSALFVKLGMGAETGVSWRLPRAIGEYRAREMMLMGGRIPAETAREWGLVNRVFDDEGFREQAWTFAAEVAQGGPVAIAEVRKLLDASWGAPYIEHVRAEHAAGGRLSRTDDAREAFRAFVEKRPPRFQGR
jgi:2-(1,2-epoxy-1,2-dihydrophenyl)acetyl-CoA isomerase